MPRPSWVRSVLALAAGAGVAALGAQIAGEYELGGVVALAAGAGIGAAVAEVVVAIAGGGTVQGGAAAVLGGSAVVWAGWLDSGEGLEPFPAMAWAGAAVAVVVAAWRGTRRRTATASRG